ncbi:MAG: hypothetical protein LLH30_04935 [Candidatus Manganitrophus sp. SA1]|nr:hypothetical protein [Candidatus Manganitrophus morganii]
MTRLLFTVLLITLLTFLLGRFLGKFLYRRPAGSAERVAAGDALVQDPNCLTYLSRKVALEAKQGGVTHYFCGPVCAEAFEKKKAGKESGV